MLACHPKIRDSTPEIRPAGKVIVRGHGAKECLVESREGGRVTPDIVIRMRGATCPGPGMSRDMRLRNSDPPVDGSLSHGIKSASSEQASELVNPPLISKFQQVHLNHMESLYHSKKNAPLGKSHDQTPCLPEGLDPMVKSFGAKTVKGESAGPLVSPMKSAKEVEEEYNVKRELYKKSHGQWDVGETVDRKYDWSKFTKDTLYGAETPHDNSGSQVNKTMHWLSTDEGKIISKRLDAFREKFTHQVGKVNDPIVETLNVPPDHTFGITVPVDGQNAGELVQSHGPATYSEYLSLDEGAVASIRNYLRRQKFHNFPFLLEAFRHMDKEGKGSIPADDVREIAFRFALPLTTEMLEMLISWCSATDTVKDAVIYEDLVELMNWKESLEIQELSNTVQTAIAKKPLSLKLYLLPNYKTTSQSIKGVVGPGSISTNQYRSYGVPTIRSDLPAPRIKRVSDNKNYGDESGSYGLMYPSIYSNHGVYEEDFFKPHPPEKIWSIFENIGVSMPEEVFQEVWKEAAQRNSKKEVSVELFRSVLEEIQTRRMLQELEEQGRL